MVSSKVCYDSPMKRTYAGDFDAKWQPDPISGCHIWNGPKNKMKYGFVYGQFTPGVGLGRIMAHRYAYERAHGPIPEGFVIDHLCRTPLCVNPAHMEVVTIAENVRRGVHSNTKVTHCPQGHPYAGENLYVKPSGQRLCKRCRRADHAWKRFEERMAKPPSQRAYDRERPRALPPVPLAAMAFDAIPAF